MKFAKELERDLVPEWRAKYLNYKLGKKKVKAVSRALRTVEQSQWTPPRRGFATNFLRSDDNIHNDRPRLPKFSTYRANSKSRGSEAPGVSSHHATSPRHGGGPSREREPLRTPASRFADHTGGYGSIVTPTPSHNANRGVLPSLELPDPALDPDTRFGHRRETWTVNAGVISSDARQAAQTVDKSIPEPRDPNKSRSDSIIPGPRNIFRGRSRSIAGKPSPGESAFRRMFGGRTIHASPASHAPSEAYEELACRETEFFDFLDRELSKIEAFYKLREEEATERLRALKDQLHVMRDIRFDELRSKSQSRDVLPKRIDTTSTLDNSTIASKWRLPLDKPTPSKSKLAKMSKEMELLSTPGSTLPRLNQPEEYKDFVRRQDLQDVPYRSARRKLKLALLEFYRGLELLKAYAYLNRKALRKINKKYEKAANVRPTGRYMSEKVNKAWFVQSEIIENHLVAVEDLYARYFERGNRKVAVTKLRGKTSRSHDYSPSSFRNGILFAGGMVFGIQGLVDGIEHLFDESDTIRIQTSYLLQLYGGYTLILLHFLLFCFNCRIWSSSKINYAFVFEYDTRHVLDWRQLAEIPCFFVFLLGLCMWANFRWITTMHIYWPIILIGLTVGFLFLPARVFYHRSRKWWAYSNWRLLLAGFYPVEFRDFFLGDMYCSQTYAMGNLALFSCLYANDWSNPPSCNSSHSRALGFLTALPSIWRAFQCIRRYWDTRNIFPHLVNFGKYGFSILYYMSLSLYRIERVSRYRALFITFALLNAIYSSIWDVAMDWSVGNLYSKNWLLRDYLGFQRKRMYYVAMVVDPLLRFNWIFYAIFPKDFQHSAILSFMVALSEVLRRGMWSIFRVENEHCTNVCRFRASRDLPLPYDIPEPSKVSPFPRPAFSHSQHEQNGVQADVSQTTSADVERTGSEGVRRRAFSTRSDGQGTLARVGTMLANAHAEDFQRKKRPGIVGSSHEEEHPHHTERYSSTDDEEEESDEQDIPRHPLNGNISEEDERPPN